MRITIYILYYNDVVECYDYEGNYIYSVSFKRKSNGISSLYQYSKSFVFEDGCGKHYYIVDDDKKYTFLEFKSEAYYEFEKTLMDYSMNHPNNAGLKPVLERRGSNLFCCFENGEFRQITSRPAWLIILQNEIINIPIVISSILVFVFGILYILNERKLNR